MPDDPDPPLDVLTGEKSFIESQTHLAPHSRSTKVRGEGVDCSIEALWNTGLGFGLSDPTLADNDDVCGLVEFRSDLQPSRCEHIVAVTESDVVTLRDVQARIASSGRPARSLPSYQSHPRIIRDHYRACAAVVDHDDLEVVQRLIEDRFNSAVEARLVVSAWHDD